MNQSPPTTEGCQTTIWLDDERNPSDSRWHPFFPVADTKVVWVKSFEAFCSWMETNGLPDAICFDHDLGDGPSGFDAAKAVTEYCLESGQFLPAWNVQSANPIGKQNIISILKSFERIQDAGALN